MSDATSNIVGGVIGANYSTRSCVPVHLVDVCSFVNARSCIDAVIANRSFRMAWLPSYLCDSVLMPFSKHGCSVRFYPIDDTLECSDVSWISEVEESDVVLGINYFGLVPFPHFRILRETGACLIEDLSQALFQPRDPDADFAVYSLRKFLPVIDGGFLAARVPGSFLMPTQEAENELSFGPAAAAFFGRGLADLGVDKIFDWFGAFKKAEGLMPVGPVAMSKASRWIFNQVIDFESAQDRRKRNFSVLKELLGEFHPFQKIMTGAVPLGFPIVVADRRKLLSEFYSAGIFPPVHWPLRHFLPEKYYDSHRLADSILTLICDQRFSVEQMARQSELVVKHATPLFSV
jgi:hypothetical protein